MGQPLRPPFRLKVEVEARFFIAGQVESAAGNELSSTSNSVNHPFNPKEKLIGLSVYKQNDNLIGYKIVVLNQ